MGLPSRVARRQTLMNTSPSRYMNPIPCGVKVNDPGRHHRRRGTGRPRPHVNYPPLAQGASCECPGTTGILGPVCRSPEVQTHHRAGDRRL